MRASNPDVVYIGTGEADIRGNIIQGDGAYKSTDAGKTWTHIGLADTQVIAKIRVHPTNPDLVYVAAFGHHAAPNPERGVYRSKDGGKTWDKILFRDNKTGANELIIDPNNPQVIYAALWEAYRNAWEMSSGGPGSGIFKSTDGGDHWTEISRNPGLPKAMLGKIGLSVSGADSNRVYAQIEAEDGGFFLSDDAGATWKKVSERPRPAAARVLLHARLRRSEGEGHRLGAERQHLQVDRRRQDLEVDQRAARRQPRHVDRAERLEPDDRGERRRRHDLGERRRDVDGRSRCRRRSSIT